MIVAGLLVLVTLPLIPILIPSLAPASVQAGLESIHSQSLLYGTTWGLYMVSDLLFLIPFPALYVVLRRHNRATTLIALIFNSLFVTIDVGVDIPLRFVSDRSEQFERVRKPGATNGVLGDGPACHGFGEHHGAGRDLRSVLGSHPRELRDAARYAVPT